MIAAHRGRRRRRATSAGLGRFAAVGLPATVAAAPLAGEALPLRPSSILAVSGFEDIDTVVEYTPAGELLASLEISDPEGLIGTPSGLAMAAGSLWVGGSDSVVSIDVETGVATPGFPVTDSPTLVGLADDGEHLLVGELFPDRVFRFDLEGQRLDTIVLATEVLMTGLDTDGSLLFVSSHATGDVHIFGMDGQEVGVVETDLPSDLTGVTLDSDGETLWVTTGTGANEIHRFDFHGTLLHSFPADAQGLMGLHALPGGIFADGFESGDARRWSLSVP